jgi:putative CRISPR-associated protein (TIGR02620 family)
MIDRGRGKASKSGAWSCAEEAARIADVKAFYQEGTNFPDFERLETDVWSALGEMKLIVTRHRPLVDWLAARGITGKVIDHASPEDVAGRDVYGVLPQRLAAEANSITEVDLSGLSREDRIKFTGGDFSVEDMDRWGAVLQRYIVRKG